MVGTGDRLSPSHAIKAGKRYRYYTSHRLMEARRNGDDGWRLSAKEIENLVIAILHRHLTDKLCLTKLLELDDASPRTHQMIFRAADHLSQKLETASAHELKKILRTILNRIELHSDTLIIEINVTRLESLLRQQATNVSEPDRLHRIETPHQLKMRGVEGKLIIDHGATSKPNHDPYLVGAIAKAHHWLHQLTTGKVSSIDELAGLENEDRNELSRNLPLAFLAPDITRAIVSGTQPASLTASRLKRVRDLPLDWSAQARMLGCKTA